MISRNAQKMIHALNKVHLGISKRIKLINFKFIRHKALSLNVWMNSYTDLWILHFRIQISIKTEHLSIVTHYFIFYLFRLRFCYKLLILLCFTHYLYWFPTSFLIRFKIWSHLTLFPISKIFHLSACLLLL